MATQTESETASGKFRKEHDLLGDREVPAEAYYGVQTLRAFENFRISDIPLSHFPNFIRALAMVKKACARANRKLGNLEAEIAEAICRACDDIIEGQYHDQFIVDMIQGGAGTSTNMNANEVIANRALEILGHSKGEYKKVHPNNHVNLSQSTNDVYPTAIRLGILLSYEDLTRAMTVLNECCVRGITANEERCRELVMNSIGLVTALNPYIGYENATRIAKTALQSGRGVAELALEEGLLSQEELDDILKPEHMTKPRRPKVKSKVSESK